MCLRRKSLLQAVRSDIIQECPLVKNGWRFTSFSYLEEKPRFARGKFYQSLNKAVAILRKMDGVSEQSITQLTCSIHICVHSSRYVQKCLLLFYCVSALMTVWCIMLLDPHVAYITMHFSPSSPPLLAIFFFKPRGRDSHLVSFPTFVNTC